MSHFIFSDGNKFFLNIDNYSIEIERPGIRQCSLDVPYDGLPTLTIEIVGTRLNNSEHNIDFKEFARKLSITELYEVIREKIKERENLSISV